MITMHPFRHHGTAPFLRHPSRRLAQALLLILLTTGWTQSLHAQSDEQLIRAARARSNAAIAAHDTTGMIAEWTSDYHIVSSRNSEVAGASKNAAWFAQEFSMKKDVVYVRTPGRIEVNTSWNMASETGTWEGTWQAEDGKVIIGGTYYAKWHKVKGRWKIRAEIFTPLHCEGSSFCDTRPF